VGIEDTIYIIEDIIERKLTELEVLIMGLAYQEGFSTGIKHRDDIKKVKPELKRTPYNEHCKKA
jgi:hypothetical protein